MTDLKQGTKIQITDKKHENYLEVFVIMFKVFDNIYGYGKEVHQRYSDGRINVKQIKVIE